MVTRHYLPPYTFLTAQFLGSLRPYVARESVAVLDDLDIFDDIAQEAATEGETPVVINNENVGEVDLPVSDVKVTVNESEGTFPVIKDQNKFAQGVSVIGSVIAENPGQQLEINISGQQMTVAYAGQRVQVPVEIVSPEDSAQEEMSKEFDSYINMYLAKVYGVKLEANNEDFFNKYSQLLNLPKTLKQQEELKQATQQKETRLQQAQAMKIDKIFKSWYNEVMNDLRNNQNLSPEERATIIRQLDQNMDTLYQMVVDELKNNPKATAEEVLAKLPVKVPSNIVAKIIQNKDQAQQKGNSLVGNIVKSVSSFFGRIMNAMRGVFGGSKEQPQQQGEEQGQQAGQAQNKRFAKIREFKEKHPKLFITIALSAAVGVLFAVFKVFKIKDRIKRLLDRRRKTTRESVSVYYTPAFDAMLDVAGTLMIYNPHASEDELVKQALTIVKKSGPQGIQNYNKFQSIFVSQEAIGDKLKAVGRGLKNIGLGALKALAVLFGAALAGAKILGLSIVIAAIMYVLGIVFMIAGTPFAAAGSGIAATGGFAAILAGATLTYMFPVIIAIGAIGGLVYAGYTLVKRIANMKTDPKAPSDAELTNQLTKANRKTLKAVYDLHK